MKRTVTTFGALALAALTLGAAATSSASAALPEFTKAAVCEQTGELLWLYTESACATDSASDMGEFALSPILAESEATTLETVSGLQIACKRSIGQGETTGPKTVSRLVLKFKECSSGGNSCATSGAVSSSRLQGTLGYINALSKEVGLDLTPEASGGTLLEFSCEGAVGKVQVKGSVISKITPVNEPASFYTLAFALTKEGKQNVTKFEGGTEDVLELSKEGGAFEKAALETTDTVFPFVTGEIKA